MCPCCGKTTSRFNVNCETCFDALLSGRQCTHFDASYEPMAVCECGTSMHDNAFNRAFHARKCGRAESIRTAGEREHREAGWNTTLYPERIY